MIGNSSAFETSKLCSQIGGKISRGSELPSNRRMIVRRCNGKKLETLGF